MFLAACTSQVVSSPNQISPTSQITATHPVISSPTLAPLAGATVISTLSAIVPTQTELPVVASTEAWQQGYVTGELSYPSEGIPSMILYFENMDTGAIVTLPIEPSQRTYSVTLPSGVYVAYAWTIPDERIPAISGGFTHRQREYQICDYHDLERFTVQAKQTATGIDIFNWYPPVGAFPSPPELVQAKGAIQGIVLVQDADRYETIVYARNTATGKTQTVVLTPNTTTFRLDDVNPGWYYIYSWTRKESTYIGGSHSVEGICGNLTSCERRCMTPVEVSPEETVADVNVVGWIDTIIAPPP